MPQHKRDRKTEKGNIKRLETNNRKTHKKAELAIRVLNLWQPGYLFRSVCFPSPSYKGFGFVRK